MRLATVLAAPALLFALPAHAFCGFYVAKADAKLFNKASQVALVHDGDRTVMTISNDFQGDLKEFAIVIPVPTALEKEQVHIGEKALLEHLDAYSSPRLVEYWDNDPCRPVYKNNAGGGRYPMAMRSAEKDKKEDRAAALGVKIEASYTVGEYDILILAAKQSDGLETWLREEGYKIPKGASEVLGSYLKQGMHFFVAKVNLTEQSKTGYTFLRPIQVAYESPKFMLPIRLGTLNADGPQELFVYTLTKNGRVETTNYKTQKLPSDTNVPEYTKEEFGPFYKALFKTAVKKNDMKAVFTEYAWDMGWCDPCASEPLSQEELKKLGVYWLANPSRYGGGNPFITRLHVRYDAEHFPEDLVFQETSDKSNFQGRYIMQHPFKGYETSVASCSAMPEYRKQVHARHEQEAKNLAELTGWDADEIRKRMKIDDDKVDTDKGWYQNLWK